MRSQTTVFNKHIFGLWVIHVWLTERNWFGLWLWAFSNCGWSITELYCTAGALSSPYRYCKINIYACHKQATEVWVPTPVAWTQPRIFQTKQEHNLLKALSVSQSDKYVIVAIFRWLSLLSSFAVSYMASVTLLCFLPILVYLSYPF